MSIFLKRIIAQLAYKNISFGYCLKDLKITNSKKPSNIAYSPTFEGFFIPWRMIYIVFRFMPGSDLHP